MSVKRLSGMAGIGVDRMGSQADSRADPEILRLENLDTDLRPPPGVIEATREALGRDDANSYLPFPGAEELRRAAATHVSGSTGIAYDWNRTTLVSAGGLNGILNVLLAVLEPGDEVVIPDPIYIGLTNRIRLAGGIPRFVGYAVRDGAWRLDLDTLEKAVSPKTRAFLFMSPSMPAGAVLTAEEWVEVCRLCERADAWMIYDAAMERILFDGIEPVHPASLPGMAERTVTVGSVSKEYRMIGWRIGWVVSPPELVDDIGLVAISNVVCNVGIAQSAAATALRSSPRDLVAATSEWEARRDVVLSQLKAYRPIKPQGGWSLLVDLEPLGLSGAEASERLLERGKVAATPMTGWGSEQSSRYLRLVFSNEPVERLATLEERFAAAFDKPPLD